MNKKILTIALILSSESFAINVPLTVQEALYPGSIPGVARTNEPVTVGIPLPDDATNGATDVSQLGLSGASVGQFRVLGRWPSGRIKWVLVDTLANITAGSTNTSIALSAGAGNFGGGNLAADNGSTITVATGTMTCTIRKALYNGCDIVDVGATHVVLSGTSQGFVVLGPDPTATYPANVTCAPTPGGTPCTTIFSSVNDPNSACSIEENGPVRATVKCTFDHRDTAGHVYMRGTARMSFYKNKTSVKITSELRNADYGTSNTFATAFKGHQGYEFRVTPNITGTLNYKIANDTASPTTGTLNRTAGTDSVYLYQGDSQFGKSACVGCVRHAAISTPIPLFSE